VPFNVPCKPPDSFIRKIALQHAGRFCDMAQLAVLNELSRNKKRWSEMHAFQKICYYYCRNKNYFSFLRKIIKIIGGLI
jgi:hypothetical protein